MTVECQCDEAVRNRNPRRGDPPPSTNVTCITEDGEIVCLFCWEVIGWVKTPH